MLAFEFLNESCGPCILRFARELDNQIELHRCVIEQAWRSDTYRESYHIEAFRIVGIRARGEGQPKRLMAHSMNRGMDHDA